MADKLIIDNTTRVIRGLTSDDSPFLHDNETSITMPSLVIGLTKGKKLNADNVTIEDASSDELETYKEISDPGYKAIKKYKKSMDNFEIDQSPENLLDVLLKLRKVLGA